MRLAERELKALAAATGASEKAIYRLLGSVRVRIPSPSAKSSDTESSDREIDVGLRLQNAEVLTSMTMTHGKDGTLKRLETAVREYFSACAPVCGWIGRGDFDPQKIPQHISAGSLLHACRTAGRVRAKALRT